MSELETPSVTYEPPAADATRLPTAIATAADTALITVLPYDIAHEVADLIRITKLDEYSASAVLEKFRAGFEPFLRLRAEAEAIIVTDPSQTDLIARARDIDNELLAAEKSLAETHKTEKEYWLRGGQMVDGCKRIPTNAIAKTRAHLKQQFDYVRRIETERIEKIAAGRRAQLDEYKCTLMIPGLGQITDEQFQMYLDGAKAQFEKDQQAAEISKAEAEKLRAENERLQAEAAQRRATEDRRLARVGLLSRLGMVYDGISYVYEEITFSNVALNDESDAVFEAEYEMLCPEIDRRKGVKAEQARLDAQNARIAGEQLAQLERERAEKAAKEKALALGPDKDKIFAFLDSLSEFLVDHVPSVAQPEAGTILATFQTNVGADMNILRNATNALATEVKTADTPF